MKKILSTFLALVLVAGICTSAVSAHNFTAEDTNIETRYYVDGEYVGSEFSWGGNDHPYAYVYEYEQISSGMYHEGLIPKVDVVKRGPYGTIASTGSSTTTTFYDATYAGWVDCTLITITLGEQNEEAE